MVKNKKVKETKIMSDDVVKVRNMLILLVGVVIVCVGLFFLTEKMIEKDTIKNEEINEVEFDNDIATIGTMFNRNYDEYYVLLYSKEEHSKDLDSVLDAYRSSDNYIKTYFIDLDLKINNLVLGEEFNKKPNNSNEVKVNDATLYKINKGKVTTSYSGVEDIKNILK